MKIIKVVLSSFILFLSFTNYTEAAPVTIEETKFHVTILKGGKLEVHYQLTFTEHQSRDKIKKIGKFFEPIKFIQSYGMDGRKRFNVSIKLETSSKCCPIVGSSKI